jgi:hypothetical protein
MNRLLLQGVVIVTTAALRLLDVWMGSQIGLLHHIEVIREWARLKLDNNQRREDENNVS